jgi:hypothetical protein
VSFLYTDDDACINTQASTAGGNDGTYILQAVRTAKCTASQCCRACLPERSVHSMESSVSRVMHASAPARSEPLWRCIDTYDTVKLRRLRSLLSPSDMVRITQSSPVPTARGLIPHLVFGQHLQPQSLHPGKNMISVTLSCGVKAVVNEAHCLCSWPRSLWGEGLMRTWATVSKFQCEILEIKHGAQQI